MIASKPLLSKKIFDQFNQALKDRSKRGHYAEITFIGVNSAKIKEHKKIDKILNVTVDFVAEVITCIKDREKKIISAARCHESSRSINFSVPLVYRGLLAFRAALESLTRVDPPVHRSLRSQV